MSVETAVAVVVGWIVLIVVHELGHVVAAKLVGYGVERVTIGVGPVIHSAEVGGAALELRLAPLGGGVLPLVRVPDRWRFAAVYAGGPVASAAAVALVLLVPLGGYRVPVMVVAVAVLLVSLLPLAPGIDGWELLAIAAGRRDHRIDLGHHVARARDGWQPEDADVEAFLDNALTEVETEAGSKSPEILTVAGVRRLQQQRYGQAMELLRRALGPTTPQLPFDVDLVFATACAEVGDFVTAWHIAMDRLGDPAGLSADDEQRAHLTLFEVDRQLRRFDLAAGHLGAARAVGSVDSSGWLDLMDGVLAQDQGLFERSASWLELAIEQIRSEESLGFAETVLARTRLEQGDLEGAHRLLSSAHPRVVEDRPLFLGFWKMTEGVRRRLVGEHDASMMALAEARELFAKADVVPQRARVALEAARTELARGNPERARRVFGHASTAFAGLGACGWCELIDQEVALVFPAGP